jgi:carboxyl-terminal processing protease
MPEKIKKSAIRIYEPLLVSLAAAIGLIAGYKMNFNNNDYSLIKLDKQGQMIITRDGRIEEILRFVETNYVDSLDQDEIAIDAIKHILRRLDPHSSYITADELQDHNEKMEGRYKGVGIETIEFKDTFYIMRVIDGSPAAKAGVQIGDAILSINGEALTGKNSSFSKIRSYFRKSSKKAIDIELLSLASKTSHDLRLKADDIEIPSANMSYLLDDHIAYIKLTRFSANTYEQFMQSIEKLIQDKQALDLVIDLRDNPGGYLPEAINILSQLFADKNKLLCFTEGLNRKRSDYHSTGKTFYNIGKVVVLINEYSASGSEILAGAIQDWDRGIIIGQPSYGKGLVQEIFPLKNGGALRLTVARYYTPSGRLIQKYYDNINHNVTADTSAFKTLLLEREVAGGGGIRPDIYVEDPFNDYCYNYSDYVDYYLLHKMKASGSSNLDEASFSKQELNDFISLNFAKDVTEISDSCSIDIQSHLVAKYHRLTEGENAYQRESLAADPYIEEALDFIKAKKTTLALLNMEK